jgi:hypothetical protein
LLLSAAGKKIQRGLNRERFIKVIDIHFRLKCRCARKERTRAIFDRWDVPRDFAAWFVSESKLLTILPIFSN